MLEAGAIGEAVLEVIAPEGGRRLIRVTQSPFLIGRGGETGNHLQLSDRRISRQCAALVFDGGTFYLEDRGQRRGLFVNDEKVENRALADGDVVTFGMEDSYQLVFRVGLDSGTLPQLLTRMEHISTADSGAGGLRKLSMLLEATALLQSQLPLEAVLGEMVNHAITLTNADRGLLLQPGDAGALEIRLARRSGGQRLPVEGLTPSQTAVRRAVEQKTSIVTEDVAQAGPDLKAARSVIAQQLRSVVVVPLYASAAVSGASVPSPHGELLGVLYLDSRRPAAFSSLERQILDALAVEAASVLDNARLVARERERERLEQELGIAREIQQALLPRGFRDFPFMRVTGTNLPCRTVGGDYFDVLPLGPDRTAFLIADVSGKGIGAALLSTMLQGALSGMTLGQEPAKVFNHINRFLCEHAEVGRYATMFYAVLDGSGRLEFINAGHPSPIILRGGGAEAPFEPSSFPVGLIPEAEYTSSVAQLQPDDTLVLFSDGVTEAMNAKEEEFGMARLCRLLKGRSAGSLEELQRLILSAVDDFTCGARQADDVTLLLVCYRCPA